MGKSIKGKMVLMFTAILFGVIFAQLLFNMFFAEKAYVLGRQKELMSVYSKLTHKYSVDSTQIYNTVSEYEDEINLRVFIFDTYGNVIYQTLSNSINSSLLTPYTLDDDGNLQANFSQTPKVNIVKSYRNNTQTIAIRGSIETSHGTNYIILETPMPAIRDATQTLNNFTMYISIFTMLIGIVSIYIFASKLSNPISEITAVAKNVAKFDFSKKARYVYGHDEISDLAQNINFMSDQLEKMIYDLKIANIELKKDNDMRKQIDDMRREFISNVSHELKTPLSLMQGYSEILKSDIDGIDKDFYYDVIIDESRHMNELVKRLLDISSLENGLTKLNYEKFDLSLLTNWIVSKNKILIDEQDITITQNYRENSFILADKLFIEQAVTNFLSNALTYCKENIVITIDKIDTSFRLSIFNDGDRIDEPSKIWDSFVRADKARTRSKDKNFGLGLYIVKTIINAHNGSYGVSNYENGVEFWFEIESLN